MLTADAGPSARYRAFLAVSRGAVQVVVGTRAAAFAPVHDLGLVAMWDDGDDLYAEPRAPYPHTREVLLLRAHEEQSAALVGGFARTVEAEYLVRTGWAQELVADRATLRRRRPRSRSPGPPTASSSATRTPAAPGCPARRTTRSGTASRRGRCCCRRPGRATRPRCPATAAAPRRAARSAPDRSS